MSIENPIAENLPTVSANESVATWAGLLDDLIESAATGSADRRVRAIEELRRMAETADEYHAAERELAQATARLDAIGKEHDVHRNRRLHLYVAACRGLEELGFLPAPAAVNRDPEDPEIEQYHRMVACRDRLAHELDEHARCSHGKSGNDEPLPSEAHFVLGNLNRWIERYEDPLIAWAAPPSSGAKPAKERARTSTHPAQRRCAR
jgi:hypothetical protein